MLHTIKHGMLGELIALLALAGTVRRGVREVHIERGRGKRKKRKGKGGVALASRKKIIEGTHVSIYY